MHLSKKGEKTCTFGEKISDFLFLFILLSLIWLALTSSVQIEELITGFIISFILSLVLFKDYRTLGLPNFSIKRFVFFIIYSSLCSFTFL